MDNVDRTWTGDRLGGKTKEGFSVSLTSCWESQVHIKLAIGKVALKAELGL